MCCVWAEPQGLCVRRQRIAELAGPGVVFAATTPQVGTAGSRTITDLPYKQARCCVPAAH